jgi:LuxR family maltose regulon positive regulatory protein
VERFLARLIEVVGDLPRPLLLVGDDAQEIAHAEASAGLERLVWLAPEQLRVIISTSVDPRMSLPRLRANGDVVEIRARDLAFTAREAAELMSGLGVRLAPEQVLLLTHRTEGWAAALRLAALSLRDRSDPDEFVRAFAGNHRAVADYLVEEVLGRLPASLARFLLCTSIVERFTADLAAGLTGDEQADLALDSLDRDYSLVSPFGEGHWYRHHRLLAEILPVRLAHEQPDDIGRLHGIAARWFGEHGLVTEAVRHAAAANDVKLTSRLLSDVSLTNLTGPESAPLRSLAEAVPSITVANNAGVAVTVAAARLADGDPDGALRLVGARYAAQPGRPGVAHRVRARSTAVAMWAARETGDIGRVLDETRLASDEQRAETALDEEKFLEAVFHAHRGWALLWSGDARSARSDLQEAIAAARVARSDALRLLCQGQLSLLEMWLGRVTVASDLARSALNFADERGMTTVPEAASVYLAFAWIHDERGEPDAVQAFLDGGREALRGRDMRDVPASVVEACMQARVHRWHGRPDVGANLLSAMRRRIRGEALSHLAGFVAVEEAAMDLASGARTAAARAIDGVTRRSRPTGKVSIRARLLRDNGDSEAAARSLQRHLGREPSTHLPDVVEGWVLLASVLRDRREVRPSWDALERALHLAVTHGIARPFLLQDDARELLEDQLKRGTAHQELCRDLLDAIDAPSPSPPTEGLVETLASERRPSCAAWPRCCRSKRSRASFSFPRTR